MNRRDFLKRAIAVSGACAVPLDIVLVKGLCASRPATLPSSFLLTGANADTLFYHNFDPPLLLTASDALSFAVRDHVLRVNVRRYVVLTLALRPFPEHIVTLDGILYRDDGAGNVESVHSTLYKKFRS